MKAGMNVWINFNGETVKSDTCPGEDYYPHYNEHRVTGDSYMPYCSNSHWAQWANLLMAETARANFQRRSSY